MFNAYGYFEHFDEKTAGVYRFIEVLLYWAYSIATKTISELVPPPARILEVGPGTGKLASMLSNHGYYVVGIDVSLPMLRRAKRFWRPDFANGGSWRLPIINAKFDAAVATFTLHHWGDHEPSIRNVYESLKPGSVFVVIEADGDRFSAGGHSCTKDCLLNVLSPYFNVTIKKIFPLIIAIGRKTKLNNTH
ncbi:MAG: class I SAM-dependent methyltransferase [Vulcanisaeta sp.]